MNDQHQELIRGCNLMLACMQVHCDAFLKNYNALPEARRNEISRLGSAMWHELTEAKKEATSMADGSFQRFKNQLLKKPRKNSRLYKEINHG